MDDPLDFIDQEPEHEVSQTAAVLDRAQLFGLNSNTSGHAAGVPDEKTVQAAISDIFDALVTACVDTSLETDLGELLWSAVNLFHRTVDRLERRLDQNEHAQKRSQSEQDGSEVRSVELEDLLDEGRGLIDRRNALESMRELAIQHFEAHTGSAWRPRAGSLVTRSTLTAAMIDSRDFLAARRRAETEIMLPQGPRIAFSGGADCNDHHLIWSVLDRVHAKHPDMVLLHGGASTGAELIAAKWAATRGVVEVAFRPDFKTHSKRAAPMKRNDVVLAQSPIGVVVFPGGGIQDNLADKARKLGVPVFDFRRRGGA
ncbi:DUF2493 domain-containing protein [Phenylobacterium montanum]|uniref:DUF2493 domain-containing protein n=1 Tax=Phenylobacterium montanum TaxID=2823693 RepID=A0A975G4D4_9CAUL|nr:DUF2493 domain-containing protein [Caulobacter sp. S6]QUD90426.1 DUF2493 domain-containing protein [Caulobacter sp. S6]